MLANFVRDYQQLCHDFDQLERESLFNGARMEALVVEFLSKYQRYIGEFCREYSAQVSELLSEHRNSCNKSAGWYESLDVDLRLLELKIEREEVDEHEGEPLQLARKPFVATPERPHELVADIYRRACESCYLRAAANKARARHDDDRRESVAWGQRALRYAPDNFLACYWYMIALGWYLESVSNARERTLAGEAFKRSIKRCLRLDPQDPLSYHLLGRYYYFVAELTWIQKSIARTFLGGASKIEGTYEDSERALLRGHALRPNWPPTGLWMARVLLAQGKPRAQVEHWIRWGLELEAVEPSTVLEREELLELRRKLKM